MTSHFNKDIALERMGGDPSLYERLQGYFIRDYADYPDKATALIEKEEQEAYVLTHSLKNIAASLGADKLAQCSLNLEVMLKKGYYSQSKEVLLALIEEFYPALSELKEHYKEEDSLMGVAFEEEHFGETMDFLELLELLAQGLGSFSPDKANEVMRHVRSFWMVIPPNHREEVSEILSLAKEYRYLDGEDRVYLLIDEVKKNTHEE